MIIIRAVRRVTVRRPSRAEECERQAMVLRLPTLRKFRSWRNAYNGLPESFGADIRPLGPVHVCSCGSQVFSVLASFDDYELVWYFLDATCASCGNLVRVPCPPDRDEAQTLGD